MIIAIDFDGTISRGEYPAIDGEQPYAGEVIRKLHNDGHYIIIWTCRCGDQLLSAINWLLEHKIPFDRVNDHNPDNVAQYGEGGKKVFADVYIDDRNLGGFPGWATCEEMIAKMVEDSPVNPIKPLDTPEHITLLELSYKKYIDNVLSRP